MYNHAVVGGRLGQDPELKYLDSGTALCSGSVAVPRPTGKGQEKITDWIRFTAWGKTAEALANWGRKGNRIIVSGRIQVDDWQDKEGNKRNSVSINAREIQFVDWPDDSNSKPKQKEATGDFPF